MGSRYLLRLQDYKDALNKNLNLAKAARSWLEGYLAALHDNGQINTKTKNTEMVRIACMEADARQHAHLH